jgi:hypothetical protein
MEEKWEARVQGSGGEEGTHEEQVKRKKSRRTVRKFVEIQGRRLLVQRSTLVEQTLMSNFPSFLGDSRVDKNYTQCIKFVVLLSPDII